MVASLLHTSMLLSRPRVCVTFCRQKQSVEGPPPQYDFRQHSNAETRIAVEQKWPELMDLVDDGSLIVVKRPSQYVERRVDGYIEPETVILIGTAHMSQLSAVQVERAIRTIRPECVVVELCRSRAGLMYEKDLPLDTNSKGSTSNLMSLSGENFAQAMQRSLLLGGQSALFIRLLLAGLSQRLSGFSGILAGEEFRAARRASSDVGAQIVLGDRPIEITLKRSWEAVSWRERIKLATIFWSAMTSSSIDISEEAMEVLKTDSSLSLMFSEMSKELPSLLKPLIHERDMYLAWSLKRSKAVNGCANVIGIVGRGHMRGITYALKNNQDNLRFQDLVGKRKAFEITTFVRSICVDIVIGYLLWLIYSYVTKG